MCRSRIHPRVAANNDTNVRSIRFYICCILMYRATFWIWQIIDLFFPIGKHPCSDSFKLGDSHHVKYLPALRIQKGYVVLYYHARPWNCWTTTNRKIRLGVNSVGTIPTGLSISSKMPTYICQWNVSSKVWIFYWCIFVAKSLYKSNLLVTHEPIQYPAKRLNIKSCEVPRSRDLISTHIAS